jgi:7 transmembrane sweet-taste receptor of 3 GCPR
MVQQEDSSEEEDDDDVQVHYLSRGASIAVNAVASAGVVLAIGSCLVVHKFRKNPVLSVAQPPFLCLVCLGSMLISASSYFAAFHGGESVHPEAILDISCVAQTWLSVSGEAIVYMALFCKLWRVHRVTQFRRAQRVLVQHVIGPFVFMLLCVTGLLVAWTVQDPPRGDQGTGIQFPDGTTANSYGLCSSGTGPYGAAMSGLLVACAAVALWMSCRTRRVPENISDSLRVYQTLLSQLVIAIIAFVMMVLAELLSSITLMQLTIFVGETLMALASIGFVVLPKIFIVLYEQRMGHLPEGVSRVGGRTRVTGIPPPDEITAGDAHFGPERESRITSGNIRATGTPVEILPVVSRPTSSPLLDEEEGEIPTIPMTDVKLGMDENEQPRKSSFAD